MAFEQLLAEVNAEALALKLYPSDDNSFVTTAPEPPSHKPPKTARRVALHNEGSSSSRKLLSNSYAEMAKSYVAIHTNQGPEMDASQIALEEQLHAEYRLKEFLLAKTYRDHEPTQEKEVKTKRLLTAQRAKFHAFVNKIKEENRRLKEKVESLEKKHEAGVKMMKLEAESKLGSKESEILRLKQQLRAKLQAATKDLKDKDKQVKELKEKYETAVKEHMETGRTQEAMKQKFEQKIKELSEALERSSLPEQNGRLESQEYLNLPYRYTVQPRQASPIHLQNYCSTQASSPSPTRIWKELIGHGAQTLDRVNGEIVVRHFDAPKIVVEPLSEFMKREQYGTKKHN